MAYSGSAGGGRGRGRFHAGSVGVGFVLGLMLLLGGCLEFFQPKITDETTGKSMTADQWIAAENRRQREIEEAGKKRVEAAEAKVRETKIAATLEASKIIAQAEGDAAKAKHQLEALQVTTGATLDAAKAEAASAVADVDAQKKALFDSTDLALQQIASQRQQTQGILRTITSIPIVGQALASVGVSADAVSGNNGLGTLLMGGGGVGLLAWRGRRNADKAWDEADENARKRAEQLKADAEAKALAEARAYDAGKHEHQQTADAAQLRMLSLLINPATLAGLGAAGSVAGASGNTNAAGAGATAS